MQHAQYMLWRHPRQVEAIERGNGGRMEAKGSKGPIVLQLRITMLAGNIEQRGHVFLCA